MSRLPKCLLLVVMTLVSPSYAFQTDLHYGLTYWLARSAGLSEHDSHHMAIGNERSDSGMLDAKHAIIWQLCVKGDTNASMLTRELHFRSQKSVPAPLGDRTVANAAPYASSDIDAVIAESGTDYRDQLYRFGKALHGWQDTFSHQGEPSGVQLCRDLWMWSHPRLRGGPLSSDADITHQHPKDCADAAQASYKKLVELLARIRKDLEPPAWGTLANKAGAFCVAATKTSKARWFEENGVPQGPSILKHTSIPDGERRFRRIPDLNLEPVPAPAPIAPASAPLYAQVQRASTPDADMQAQVADILRRLDVGAAPGDRAFFERLFQVWLTTPLPELGVALAPFFGSSAALSSEGASMQTVLRVRAADRGLAVQPAPLSLAQLSPPDMAVSLSPERWRELLVPVRAREQPFLVGVFPGSNDLLAIAVPRHAPYEVVRVYASRHEKQLIIKHIDVVMFH